MNPIGKIKLHMEQLDISKKRIKTAAVTIHKEFITEEKTIVVPVTREELVIEKKMFDAKNPEKLNGLSKTIRIPILEERIEVIKHPVILENVKIYKRRYQKIEHIEKSFKKEIAHLETIGNAKFVDNSSEIPINQKK
ncbi:YsnF/AvaK domain-containing protein [Neobacillus sp. PS3-40]|uniref:YsnF/AvaK domain-containing protein n=1 Tax=Neobacillus sp. PS3-40 TaxID=3070679 RepID=UPI0027DFEFDC|nr:YsnF/AvaK domain-containing protein [Neobacillus sp. PS3-40]WML43301.1 YsnF/AvaK domain-containing protein [Neobacillus sp. PS3-40]